MATNINKEISIAHTNISRTSKDFLIIKNKKFVIIKIQWENVAEGGARNEKIV